METNTQVQERPWSSWPTIRSIDLPMTDIEIRVLEDGNLGLATAGPDGEVLGSINEHGLREIGWFAQYPLEFIKKLPLTLQTQVMNERIQAFGDEKIMQFVSVDGVYSNVTKSGRAVVDHKVIAETMFQLVESIGGGAVVEQCVLENDGIRIVVLSPIQEAVTPALGDILQAGFTLIHRPGSLLEINLFAKRLACLNGLILSDQVFSWKQRTAATLEFQLSWMEAAINEALQQFPKIVERAKNMAATEVPGDPEVALRDRLTAMGVRRGLIPAILEAFQLEPGNTEWHMLNAMTRFATHAASPEYGRTLQRNAGKWVEDFDIVTARLPRSLATRVGATVVEVE